MTIFQTNQTCFPKASVFERNSVLQIQSILMRIRISNIGKFRLFPTIKIKKFIFRFLVDLSRKNKLILFRAFSVPRSRSVYGSGRPIIRGYGSVALKRTSCSSFISNQKRTNIYSVSRYTVLGFFTLEFSAKS